MERPGVSNASDSLADSDLSQYVRQLEVEIAALKTALQERAVESELHDEHIAVARLCVRETKVLRAEVQHLRKQVDEFRKLGRTKKLAMSR